MRQRGRKSAAALALVHSRETKVPAPPASFNDAQKEVWRATILAMPEDWFSTENLPILESYCVTVDRSRTLTKRLNKVPAGSKLYFKLIHMEQKFARSIAMLATKMRIAQQSTYDKSKRKPKSVKPDWVEDREDEAEG